MARSVQGDKPGSGSSSHPKKNDKGEAPVEGPKVHFDTEELSDSASRLRRDSARRSSIRTNEPIVGDDIEYTFERFNEVVRPRLHSYNWEDDDLSEDAKHRIIEFDKKLVDDDNQRVIKYFSWQATSAIPTDKPIGYEEFEKAVARNPREVFEDLRNTMIYFMAVKTQLDDVHQLAKAIDGDLGDVTHWIAELESIQADSGDPALYAYAQHEKDQEIDKLNAEIQRLKARICDLTDALQAGNSHGASVVSNVTAATAATVATAATAAASDKRSAKVPGPPVFYNDESRDTVPFEQWYRQVEYKLEQNGDHYRSDRAKLGYIESRVGGEVSQNLGPYLRGTHPDPITTSAGLLTWLWDQYFDPSTKQKAIDDFNKLEMKPGDDYHTFKHSFVRLAGEIGRNKSEWKSEFHRRLPYTLANPLTRELVDENVTFEAYARMAAEIALGHKRNRERSDARKDPAAKGNRGNGGGNGRKHADGKVVKPGRINESGSGIAGGLTKDEVRKLFDEGRCFTCKEKGHVSTECPQRGKAAHNNNRAEREARIAALQARYAVNADSTGASTKTKLASNKEKLEATSGSESNSASEN